MTCQNELTLLALRTPDTVLGLLACDSSTQYAIASSNARSSQNDAERRAWWAIVKWLEANS